VLAGCDGGPVTAAADLRDEGQPPLAGQGAVLERARGVLVFAAELPEHVELARPFNGLHAAQRLALGQLAERDRRRRPLCVSAVVGEHRERRLPAERENSRTAIEGKRSGGPGRLLGAAERADGGSVEVAHGLAADEPESVANRQ